MYVYAVSYHDCTGRYKGMTDGMWCICSTMEKAIAAVRKYIEDYHDVKCDDEGGDGINVRIIYCEQSTYLIEKVRIDDI